MVGRQRQAQWNRPNKAGSWELGKCVPGCTLPYYNVCDGTSVARLLRELGISTWWDS